VVVPDRKPHQSELACLVCKTTLCTRGEGTCWRASSEEENIKIKINKQESSDIIGTPRILGVKRSTASVICAVLSPP
jgi:hypothetical protein